MNQNDYIEVAYLRVKQPIGSFYVCVMTHRQVLEIARADVRKLGNPNEFDGYLGIQRAPSPGRIKEIAKYVQSIDATFPTSITLAISSMDANGQSNGVFLVDEDSCKIKIKRDPDSARILDGQHRIEGLKTALESNQLSSDFQLNVTIFVDADLDDQAQIFSVINKAQTKVNSSLVYDLYEYAKHRSPQKSAHDIVRVLNKSEKSPFYKMVKILGTSRDPLLETIAQATLVESIISGISKDPNQDRDQMRRVHIFNSKAKPTYDHIRDEKLVFRKSFIEDKDHEIARLIVQYFDLVKAQWPKSWDPTASGQVLCKSTGVIALMKFLKELLIYSKDSEGALRLAEISFKNCGIVDESFTIENFIPGTSGQAKLRKTLKQALPQLSNPNAVNLLSLFAEEE